MRNLWKVIPPCLSDVFGFEAVLNVTAGFGIIDDSARFQPIGSHRYGKYGGSHAGTGFPGSPHGRPGPGWGPDFHGQPGPGGKPGLREILPGTRVINSGIKNKDVIMGTEEKIMDAFEEGQEQLSPDFILLTAGPVTCMIGSDLDYAAEIIAEKSGLPTAAVLLDGSRDYLYGISCTLEVMGRLLITKQDTIPDSVNILGANMVDWAVDALPDFENLLHRNGLKIISRWGMEESTENLKKAAAAAVNLVVNESGLRLARYMKKEYGIPYIAGAPFGEAACQILFLKLAGRIPVKFESEKNTGEFQEISEKDSENVPEILIVTEQFTANAIRQALFSLGYGAVRVLSFYDMDTEFMLKGDKKLTGEDDFADQANRAGVRMILGDADMKPLVKTNVFWVSLPNGGSFLPVDILDNFNMVSGGLDQWLEQTGIS